MNVDVEPSDWAHVDEWWSAHAESRSLARITVPYLNFNAEQKSRPWNEQDTWWQEYADTFSVAISPAATDLFNNEVLTSSWGELDPWWNEYIRTGHETAKELSDVMKQSNEVWENSESSFDTDPLAADLTRKRLARGPLQPHREEDWSRWLAQLLRPSEVLINEIFGVSWAEPPDIVRREVHLPKPGNGFRKPDILLSHANRGISIEVKLGDENYRKTKQTARLTEKEYDGQEWDHFLLLPERKRESLDATVKPPPIMGDGGQLEIPWDDPGPVKVVFWEEVTSAIRSLLRRGGTVDDHWTANAFLFCAVAEQQILNFQPQSVVDKFAAPANIVETIHPIGTVDTLGEQLTYLRDRLDT